MESIDIVTILGNISQSLYPIQRLVTGGAYLLGILFFITAIMKLRKIADFRAQSPSRQGMFAPLMYLVFGAFLLYLPSALDVMANTAFGVGNVLTYEETPNENNIYNIIDLFIRTAGVIWFVRGCVLVTHASEPGVQHGFKGLAFLIAGVLAMNFDNTIATLNYSINHLVTWSISFKVKEGF